MNLQTIRYYEREGLMLPRPRTSSGHRARSRDAVRRLRFIMRARELGFSLSEVRELLTLRLDPNQLCGEVIEQIETRTKEVEARISHLKAIRRALVRLKDSCDGTCPMSECPILESLDTEVS